MTNKEYADQLRAIADKYETSENENAPRSETFYLFLYTKQQVMDSIRMFGGKWIKSFSGSDQHQEMILKHSTLPLRISVPRSLVCKRTITYDCEPLFSENDIVEIDEAVTA